MGVLIAYAGLHHLAVFARRRQARSDIPFTFVCLCASAYDILAAGLYSSHSIAEGIAWQRWQVLLIAPLALGLIWFVRTITAPHGRLVLRLLMIWIALLLVVMLVCPERYTLSESPPLIKHIHWGDSLWITYHEGTLGPLMTVLLASVLPSYFYLFYPLIRRYRETRSRTLFLIIVGLAGWLLGTASDTLVAMGVYEFVYISEYAFFGVVLAMSYRLMRTFVDLDDAVRESNRSLEQKVEERTLEIRQLNDELRRLAELDGLTGIYNRRFFDEYLEIETRRACNERDHREQLRPVDSLSMNFGLAILDVDDFKRVNDNHGHQAGDRVLVEMVELIGRYTFTRDVLCRYGGEEFALILTKTSVEGVLLAVEKIRKEVDGHPFPLDGEAGTLHLTVSIGVARFDEAPEGKMDDLIRIADRRLLVAKAAGKNRVVATD